MGRIQEKRPMPDDFADRAPYMSSRELMALYRTSDRQVARWRRETGILPPNRLPDPPADFAEQARQMRISDLARHYIVTRKVILAWAKRVGVKPKAGPRPTGSWGYGSMVRPNDRDQRPDSHGLRAQTFMQRFAPCYRVDDNGRPDPAGSSFRFGRRIMSEAQLIARAEAKGFSPWTVAG